jgi:hypothetical protein
MASLGITGAIRTAPTAAMEVLLGLPPLHLQVEADAKVGNYRLYCNDQWKPKSKRFWTCIHDSGYEKRTHHTEGV